MSDVLQVVEFLGANGWLRGVEVRRGQVEEESGIEVLPQGGGASVVGEEEEVDEGDAPLQGGHAAGIEQVGTASPADLAAPAPPAAAKPAPAPPARSGLGALVADYGSDTDDDAEDERVAAALITGRGV